MKIIHWVFLLFTIFFVLFIQHYPNIAPFYAPTPPEYVYALQNPFFDPWDVNVYAATIRYGQREGVLYPNIYTTEPNKPVLVYTFLTLLGFFWKNADPFLLFHGSAVIGDILLMLGLFWGIRSIGFSFKKTVFSVLVICLGGGFGFLGPEWFSADITDSSFTFQSTFQKGHEAIAIVAYIIALLLFYHLCIEKNITLTRLGILILLLGVSIFIYPYFVVSFCLIAAVTALTLMFKQIKKLFLPLFAIFLSALAVSFLAFYQFLINPTYLSTGTHLSISIISVFMGFGVFTILYFYYLFFVTKSPLGKFLLLWISITFVVAVLPFGPGKIFFRGSFFPMVLLGILSLDAYISTHALRQKSLFYGIFFILSIATSIYIFHTRMTSFSQPLPWTYLHESEVNVMTFLNTHTPPDSGVLTNFQLSNQIPAFTHNRVFLGHMLTTPDSEKKAKDFAAFISGSKTMEEKKNFLLNNKISYLVWGPVEQSFYEKHTQKNNTLPTYVQTMKKVYTNKDFVVYEVREK